MATSKKTESAAKPKTRKRHSYSNTITNDDNGTPCILDMALDENHFNFDLSAVDVQFKARLALRAVELGVRNAYSAGGVEAARRALDRLRMGKTDGRIARSNYDLTTRVYRRMVNDDPGQEDISLDQAHEYVSGLSKESKAALRMTPEYQIAAMKQRIADIEAKQAKIEAKEAA